jgi:hypothetical protein
MGPKDRRIPIIVTEMNSADWTTNEKEKLGWPHTSNLGHALVVFDMLSAYTLQRDCDAALLWNTRWINPAETLWDAVDAKNEPSAIGTALEIYSSMLSGKRIACKSEHPLKVIAVRNDAGITVAIINRSLEPKMPRLELDLPGLSGTAKTWTGANPDDAHPHWSEPKDISIDGKSTALDLPPCSLQILQLHAR